MLRLFFPQKYVNENKILSISIISSLSIYIYFYIFSKYFYIHIFSTYVYICYRNDCWHGFWVHSWGPLVLWQAVKSWLVNWGMAVRWGKPVKHVCNRKETMWYENHAVRFRQSESRIEPRIRNQSEALGHLWLYGLQGGASNGTTWLQEEDMGQEEVPSLSICLSIYLLQQTVCPCRE